MNAKFLLIPLALAYPTTGVASITAGTPAQPNHNWAFDTVGHTAISPSPTPPYYSRRKTFDTGQAPELIGFKAPVAASREYDITPRCRSTGGGTYLHVLQVPRIYDSEAGESDSLQVGRQQAPSIRTYETKQVNEGIHRATEQPLWVGDDVTMGDVDLEHSPDHSGEDGMIHP